MTDTPQTQAQLISASADNTTGNWTNQNERNFIVSVVPTIATMTSGASITMSTTVLIVNKASGSPTAVTGPVSPIVGTQTYTLKDGKGDAGTNNITLTPTSGLIDNQASIILNINGMSISFVFDGTNMWVV